MNIVPRQLKSQITDFINNLHSLGNVANFNETNFLASLNYAKEPSESLTLVDVGAHVGSFSSQFAKKGWRVIAFEPEPSNFKQLEANLKDFQQVICLKKAVSQTSDEEVNLYVSNEHWGIHSFTPFHQTHTRHINVKTVRLDDALREFGIADVALLKIDVEGADLIALRSFDLNAIQPLIVMCEFMDERTQQFYGYTYHDIIKFVNQYDYSVYVFEWGPIKEYGRKGQQNIRHDFIGWNQYPLKHEPSWGNLIFVHRDFSRRFRCGLLKYSWHSLISGILNEMRKHL